MQIQNNYLPQIVNNSSIKYVNITLEILSNNFQLYPYILKNRNIYIY